MLWLNLRYSELFGDIPQSSANPIFGIVDRKNNKNICLIFIIKIITNNKNIKQVINGVNYNP